MPNSKIRFEDIVVRGERKTHEHSTFLGYASATLVVDDALPNGERLAVRLHGIQLKVVNGRFRWDAQVRGSDGKWRDSFAPSSRATREVLTFELLKAYNAYVAAQRKAA